MKIINIYNQIIGRGYIYLGIYIRKRRTIKDISQNRIIIEKTIFINNFNTYSSKQNLIYESSIGTRFFEKLLNRFNLIIINEEGVPIKRLLEKIFIIDLTITSSSIKDTIIQCILRISYLSMLDYEFIIVNQPDLLKESAVINNGRAIDQDIQNLIDDKDKLEAVALK